MDKIMTVRAASCFVFMSLGLAALPAFGAEPDNADAGPQQQALADSSADPKADAGQEREQALSRKRKGGWMIGIGCVLLVPGLYFVVGSLIATAVADPDEPGMGPLLSIILGAPLVLLGTPLFALGIYERREAKKKLAELDAVSAWIPRPAYTYRAATKTHLLGLGWAW